MSNETDRTPKVKEAAIPIVVFAQVLFVCPWTNTSMSPCSVMEIIHIVRVDEGSIPSVQMIDLLNYVRVISFNQMLIQG